MFMRPFGYRMSPWREMGRLRREVNRLFSDWPARFEPNAAPGYPAVNLWTSKEGAVVTAELPGVHAKDLDISVQDDTLTLRGNCQPDKVGENATYHRRERCAGTFSRTLRLPFHVEAGAVRAAFKNGVLSISLPRAETDKPIRIAVKKEV
jgi:HSP20 family protein